MFYSIEEKEYWILTVNPHIVTPPRAILHQGAYKIGRQNDNDIRELYMWRVLGWALLNPDLEFSK